MDRRPENFGGAYCTICNTEFPVTDKSPSNTSCSSLESR
jgi:hypothetical protein